MYRYVNEAIGREKELKKWRREKKLNLVKSENSQLKDLSDKLFNDYGIKEKEIHEIAQDLKEKYKRDK
jgi:uncharacterized protein YjiS (DUF1127 family)